MASHHPILTVLQQSQVSPPPATVSNGSLPLTFFDMIPVYSLQITLFLDHGFSIGMTMHHSLVDASSYFCFLEAWTCIARHGTDKLFLANTNIYPFYERVINYPELDEKFLSLAKIETLFNGEYQPSNLSSTNKNKVRATFVLARTIIDQMKKRVLTQEPTISYVSSLTVTCAYIWCCIAKSREDELEMLYMPMDCRTRMDKPIPAAYFGNCVLGCVTIAKTSLLIRDDDGFINVARLLGENLHNMLTDKDGTLAHGIRMDNNLFSAGMPTTITPVSGTPKLKYYNLDFGWGKLKKKENVSLDYGNASISIDACKESNDDLEIGISLTTSEMQTFVRVFNQGLQLYL